MSRTDIRSSSAGLVLWASAFLIAALVIVKAGELPQNAAFAGNASSDSDFSIVTASKGTGPDLRPHELLYVADNRTEMLFIFDIEENTAGRRVVLRGGGPLPSLFMVARGR